MLGTKFSDCIQFTLQKEWVPDILDGDAVKFCFVANHQISACKIDEPYYTIAGKEDFLQKHKKETDRYYIVKLKEMKYPVYHFIL